MAFVSKAVSMHILLLVLFFANHLQSRYISSLPDTHFVIASAKKYY